MLKGGNGVRGFWTKLVSAGGMLCSFVGRLAARCRPACVLLANSLASGAFYLFVDAVHHGVQIYARHVKDEEFGKKR